MPLAPESDHLLRELGRVTTGFAMLSPVCACSEDFFVSTMSASNAAESLNSRESSLQAERILGRACFTYWPPKKFGGLPDYTVKQLTPSAPSLRSPV